MTTTHLIVGALMLAAALVVTLRAYRLATAAPASVRAKVLAEQFSL
jgi:hypothetical protein